MNAADATALPPKEDPETLVLRAKPRRAIRFRRGVIIAGTAVVAVALSAMTWMSLAPSSFRFAAGEDDISLGSPRPPDALAGAPSTYEDVPKLGPPLPGDLGRPILEQQRLTEGTGGAGGAGHDDALAAERQRLAALEDGARRAAVLVQLDGRAATRAVPANEAEPLNTSPEGPTPSVSALADRSANAGREGEHVLSAGSVISASLLTGLNSDLPGLVVAQVTEPVRDSATGQFVLIPQGARLIGRYDSSVKFGQRRAFVAWERLIFPDGSAVGLDKMPASDAAGQSGLRDRVDGHGWQTLKGVLLSTVLGIGNAIGPSGEGEIARAIRQSGQDAANKAGEQLVTRTLDVQPTLVVRPGWPVRALVHQDLHLAPWKG